MLVAADRSYEFANDLLHEVLYATTPAPARRLHHRRAADVLTASPEAVGAHAAAVQDWPRAGRALLLAGTAAQHRGGVGDAQTLLDQALDAAHRAGEAELVGRVLLARARAREGLEAFDGAWEDLQAAVTAARAAGDRRLEMAALRQLGGDVPMALGHEVTESIARLRESLRLAEGLGDRRAEADVRARLAVLATHRLAFTEALDEGARAVEAGRDAGEDGALVIGLDGLKTAVAYLGHVDELARIVAEMEPLVRRADDRWYLHWTVFESAFVAVAAGRWDEARARIGEAIEADRRSGYPGHEAWFVAHLGWVARLQGRLDEALELGNRAVTLTGPAGHRWWWPTAEALLGELAAGGGPGRRGPVGRVRRPRPAGPGRGGGLSPALPRRAGRGRQPRWGARRTPVPARRRPAARRASRRLRGRPGCSAPTSTCRWRGPGRPATGPRAPEPRWHRSPPRRPAHGWLPLLAAVSGLRVGLAERRTASAAAQ